MPNESTNTGTLSLPNANSFFPSTWINPLKDASLLIISSILTTIDKISSNSFSDKLEIEIFVNNEGCSILFEDNGSGIPSKNYEDVFKPFFTLDPSRNKLKGESGLGLSITRDIIRSHGGEIKLGESKFGGLKSIIQLPI